MSEFIETGEMTDAGYEYPISCPLGICTSGPDTTTYQDGKWRCDECGKVVIYWIRECEKTTKKNAQ